MNRLNLTTLGLIVLIADSGSITEAARKASLTLAAVSKRLVELETQLQIPLFRRNGKGVTPTEAGRAVVAQARQLIFDFDRLQEQLNEFRIGKLGTIRLGANVSAMSQYVPDDLASFLQQHADIRVDLTELPSDEIIDRLSDGRLDLGIFAEKQTPNAIQVFRYRSHRLCVVVQARSKLASRKRVTFDEVSTQPIIGLEGKSTVFQLLNQHATGILNVPVRVRSYDVMCRFVQSGLGIGIMPERTGTIYGAAMGLATIALTDDWAQRTLLIGTRSHDTLTPSSRLLLESLQAAAVGDEGRLVALAGASTRIRKRSALVPSPDHVGERA
jgi:DNA-binding transcriptional LysR family regulator